MLNAAVIVFSGSQFVMLGGDRGGGGDKPTWKPP